MNETTESNAMPVHSQLETTVHISKCIHPIAITTAEFTKRLTLSYLCFSSPAVINDLFSSRANSTERI